MIFRFFLLLLFIQWNGVHSFLYCASLSCYLYICGIGMAWGSGVEKDVLFFFFFFGRMSELCPTLHLVGKARKIPYGMGVFRSLSRLSVRDFDMIQ